MTIEPPGASEPRRPHGPRDAGDAWVIAPSGERYWGRFGAAGLLAVDPARGVLLQHRVSWSHFGGTWALPGGARHEGESAIAGALREAQEEAGVPDAATTPRVVSVLDLGFWSYATVVADVMVPFDPVISDPESYELTWVPIDDVDSYPLHPGFAAAWPALRSMLSVTPAVVVDMANVMGSVPDGWWKDRAGAASRWLERMDALVEWGVDAAALGLAGGTWFPRWSVVVEGQARDVRAAASRTAGRGYAGGDVHVVSAAGSGDDEIVAEVARRLDAGDTVTVVTSDRELATRVEALGAGVRGARWLRELLEA
ncbi:NUDIX domain-containing protein [Microbacterium sp. C7(2022)]|uniref:NUDIX domain-containing protein n=1 Tax=Microbacterium sp. C7(2022) TaxID=2992759 RepID=UPI00237AD868|nr:NUDIX domain-containing protein [Microbacterium sp. C7(2022)]MDE0546679.1 NUDIX domain-containing protein [Microbacterium sp. C7(2022)]